MKTNLFTLGFGIMLCLNVQAQHRVGEGTALPENGFKDFSELDRWATESSFGGGSANRIKDGDFEVIYSDRSFTSGRRTSELVFYRVNGIGRLYPLVVVPVARREYRISVEGMKIVVETHDPAGEWTKFIELSREVFR